MKKLIACAVLIGATCALAEDSYLFWMIDPEATFTAGGGQQTALQSGLVGVRISAFSSESSGWVYGGGTYLTIWDYSNGTIGTRIGERADNVSSGSPLFAAIPVTHQGTGWTYYVELYNDSSIFARSENPLLYSSESIVALSGMSQPGTLWNVTAFVPAAVPEPSSGLLLLLGVAGLALRRRKQIAA